MFYTQQAKAALYKKLYTLHQNNTHFHKNNYKTIDWLQGKMEFL